MEKYLDIIVITGFALTSIVFPLWVSTFAAKRGRPGWSKIAILSILVGLGFIGGLAALTAASIKPGTLEKDELEISSDASISGIPRTKEEKARVQGLCPKCSSNVVHRTIMVENPASGERTRSINQDRVGTTPGTIMILLGIAIAAFTVFRFFTLNHPVGYLVAAGVGVYFMYLGMRPWLARSREAGMRAIEVFDCARCKHTWDGAELID
jgi:hypothetical protein